MNISVWTQKLGYISSRMRRKFVQFNCKVNLHLRRGRRYHSLRFSSFNDKASSKRQKNKKIRKIHSIPPSHPRVGQSLKAFSTGQEDEIKKNESLMMAIRCPHWGID